MIKRQENNWRAMILSKVTSEDTDSLRYYETEKRRKVVAKSTMRHFIAVLS